MKLSFQGVFGRQFEKKLGTRNWKCNVVLDANLKKTVIYNFVFQKVCQISLNIN